MSQDLYFYKQKILLEKAAKLLSQEEVYSAVKVLLAKRDLEKDTKLRNSLFQEINLKHLEISAYNEEIKNILEFETEFIAPQSRFFMMSKKVWSAVQKNIWYKYTEIEKNRNFSSINDGELDQNLKKLCQGLNSKFKDNDKTGHKLSEVTLQLLSDYSILEKTFKNNLLFVNIQ